MYQMQILQVLPTHYFVLVEQAHCCYRRLTVFLYSCDLSWPITHTRWFIITGPCSFQRHNLVNMQFVYTKLSRPDWEIMLCEVLSEFPKHVLPLPCNICINVTSWDGLSSFFFSFGVTVNTEAGMTIHSQSWGLVQTWPSARIHGTDWLTYI